MATGGTSAVQPTSYTAPAAAAPDSASSNNFGSPTATYPPIYNAAPAAGNTGASQGNYGTPSGYGAGGVSASGSMSAGTGYGH